MTELVPGVEPATEMLQHSEAVEGMLEIPARLIVPQLAVVSQEEENTLKEYADLWDGIRRDPNALAHVNKYLTKVSVPFRQDPNITLYANRQKLVQVATNNGKKKYRKSDIREYAVSDQDVAMSLTIDFLKRPLPRLEDGFAGMIFEYFRSHLESSA